MHKRTLFVLADIAVIGTVALGVGGAPAASASVPTPTVRLAAHNGLTGNLLAGVPARGTIRVVTFAEDSKGHPHISVTTTAGRAQAAATIATVRRSARTLAVSIDRRVAESATSNDTYRYSQWGMDKLRAETAWSLHTATGRTVAVIDTGVDGSQPDLAGRLLSGAQFLNSATSTGNGLTDPVGHGTHVAGIIGAIANNGIGVAGLAQGVMILPVRVLDANGSGWFSDIASGVLYAADHGVTAINMSLAGTYADPTLAAAVRYAQAKDIVVVAAAGNSKLNGNPLLYPADFPGVVAVAATDSTNAVANFSETGAAVTIAAPGISIASTFPGGQYMVLSGTSMASPFVAATVALVRAAAPGLSATATIADLTATADDLGAPGRDDTFGAGLVDPVAAMLAVLPKGTVPTAPITLTTGLAMSPMQIVAGAAVQATVVARTAAGVAINGSATFCSRPIGGALSCGGAVTAINGVATTFLYPQTGVDVYATFTAVPTPGLTTLTSTTSTVQIAVAPLVVTSGDVGSLSALVTPAQQQLVAAQRLVAGAWVAVASHVAATSAPWKLTGLAAGSYRVVVPATSSLLGVTSATITVR